MRGGDDHFKVTSVWNAGRWERVQSASCGGCGKSSSIHDAGHAPKPVSMMAEKFRQKGWKIASRRTGDRCPTCVRGGVSAKPPLTPTQKRAAYCRIAGVAPAASTPPSKKPKEADMPKTEPVLIGTAARAPTSGAEAPRVATREDRRRIQDALDEHYLTDKACYAKSGSDRVLADLLKVPRAWVGEERERAYGPDACEADSQDLARLADLEAVAKALEAQGLELAAKGERLVHDIAALRTGLAKRVTA